MSKLYLFGIGGTGARVIRSLAMLLASGVRCGETVTIIPILIDPDQSNGDLTKTIRLLNNYKSIRNNLSFVDDVKSDFFRTDISDSNINYRMPVANVSNKTFEQYIDYANLAKNDKALVNLLFSDDNLASSLDVGFRGNPNMGSVVLNNFNDGSLKNVLANFQSGDKIFIISSIFGGTGAAGFPLLLKTLRQATAPDYTNAAYINSATIGAISVLPYFGLKSSSNSKIQMETFISKTKAALTYYESNIDVDALYYITDKLDSTYQNVEGSSEQINKAHFVELAAALSIVDFLKDSNVAHGKEEVFKEFAVEKDNDSIHFSSLSKSTRDLIGRNMTQMFFLSEFYNHEIKASLKHAWAKDRIEESMLTHQEFRDIELFLNSYLDWLKEMSENKRAFEPLDFEVAQTDILKSVHDYEPLKSGFFTKVFKLELTGFNALSDVMETVSAKMNSGLGTMDYFMSVFYQATQNLIKNKINF